jgi:hypothetical protein
MGETRDNLFLRWGVGWREATICYKYEYNLRISQQRDLTSCSSVEVNQSFGATCSLHLQGLRASQAKNQLKASIIIGPKYGVLK